MMPNDLLDVPNYERFLQLQVTGSIGALQQLHMDTKQTPKRAGLGST